MRAAIQRTFQALTIFIAAVGTAQAGLCEKSVGRLVSAQGVVEARNADQTTWQAAKLNDKFCPGDAIRTGARSRAALVLTSETIVRLDQFTTLTLSGVDDTSTSWIDLLTGIAHFLSRTPRALKVKTPYINAGVEGTEFVVRAGASEGSVSVFEGRVLAENSHGATTLLGGETAVADANQAPVKRLVVQPRDAVQWSLYYPPLFEGRALIGTESWADAARRSALAYLAGDSEAAFAAIAPIPNDVREASFFNYRAGLLLSVGRLDEAQSDIDRSLALTTENAHALALQSVIALARNDTAAALELAHKANTRERESVPAWVALSYAQQATFDLDAARASMEQAVLRDPENVLTLARLAELHLSFGDLDHAQATADRAVSINPNIARTQAVLGFAYLTRIKTAAAQQAFERSIALDSADPLARLGLGLALIRQGKLEAGRRDIEIAATLDPNNALIRSYLGKAYYEEKRNRLAATQLDMAKRLDPKDPTPWFYDAIRKQTENRPVEALQDLQKSIELNDNRAVYRSRLLLDQDLAARSASLARTYQDLGFQQRASLEGWKSVGADPANFSAHRFLADSYAALPRHEIAQASELLQSQLLAPLNVHPIQPQSIQSNLAILEGSGPAALGQNEYNPLFARDGVTMQLNGIVGSHETFADDLIVSGIAGKTSVSLGRSHYSTNGFRPNNDLTNNIYDIFLQSVLSPEVSIQAEYRQQQTKAGDLSYNFDLNTFSPNQRQVLQGETGRIGLHYKQSDASDLIVSVIYRNKQDRYSDWGILSLPPDYLAERFTDVDSQSYTGELQYLHRGTYFNFTTGIGYFDENRTNTVTEQATTLPPPPSAPFYYASVLSDFSGRQSNVYAYGYLKLPQSVTWTLGLSYDSFDNGLIDKNLFSPKLGVIWTPTLATTIRAAFFSTLKRPLVTNQTIEPTQVAGFNQFFDDLNGSETRRSGVGLDHALTRTMFFGIEGSWRRIEAPFLFQLTGETLIDDQDEQLYRAYFYWTPTNKLAVTAEYFLERFAHNGYVQNFKTQRVPLGVGYYHPNGLFSQLVTSWIDHSVSDIAVTRKDQFWLVDMSIGFRLPNRRGLVRLVVKNLFDEQFNYSGIDFSETPRAPMFQPERAVFGQVAWTF